MTSPSRATLSAIANSGHNSSRGYRESNIDASDSGLSVASMATHASPNLRKIPNSSMSHIKNMAMCCSRNDNDNNDSFATTNGSSVIPRQAQKSCKTGRFCDCFKKNLLTLFLILGVATGTVIGVMLQKVDLDESQLFYLGFPGNLLLRMLKLMIIPVLMSSIVSATSQLSSAGYGRIGGRAVAYYLTTTIIAVILGIVLVVSIQPGVGIQNKQNATNIHVGVLDTMLDLVRNAVPSNIFTATFRQDITVGMPQTINLSNSTTKEFIPVLESRDQTNVLGLVVFSLVFGLVLGHQPEQKRKPLVDLFSSLNEVVMKLVHIIILYAPIGVCFIIAHKFASTEDVVGLLEKLGMYVATVLIGLALHGLILLPIAYVIVVRQNPYRFLLKMLNSMLMAWGTASSTATMPVTIKCLILARVNPVIVHTVVPIGTTINMDGTALYEAVAAIFIAQMEGVSMDVAKIIIISLTSTIASIGAAGIPEAGLITMAMVLTAAGLPIEAQGIIIPIDWLLDRFRTSINVWGDSVGASVVEATSQKDIDRIMNRSATHMPLNNSILRRPNPESALETNSIGLSSSARSRPHPQEVRFDIPDTPAEPDPAVTRQEQLQTRPPYPTRQSNTTTASYLSSTTPSSRLSRDSSTHRSRRTSVSAGTQTETTVSPNVAGPTAATASTSESTKF